MDCIYVFSWEYHDILSLELPAAMRFNTCGIEYLALANNIWAKVHLAKAIAKIAGCSASYELIDAELEEFLAYNNYIHVDAFINVCLEGICD